MFYLFNFEGDTMNFFDFLNSRYFSVKCLNYVPRAPFASYVPLYFCVLGALRAFVLYMFPCLTRFRVLRTFVPYAPLCLTCLTHTS